MADTRTTLLCLLLVTYFIFANDKTVRLREAAAKQAAQDGLQEARDFLSIVGNSSYGDITGVLHSLNTTNTSSLRWDGIEHARQYEWAILPDVQTRAKELVTYALGDQGIGALDDQQHGEPSSLYTNVSGEVRGRWARSRISDNAVIPQLNFSDFTVEGPYGPIKHSRFDGNFTGSSGDVTIGMRQRPMSKDLIYSASLSRNITTISADMTLSEDITEVEERLSLRGVHYPQIGLSIMSTTSSKFAGVFLLPLFALSNTTFLWSQTILNETISKMLAQSDGYGLHTVYSSETDTAESDITPACEMIVYMQQFPHLESNAALADLDQELRFPTGATLQTPPRLHFSMLVYSPDCGFILESEGPPDQDREQADHLTGYKVEVLRVRGSHHVMMFGFVTALQLAFLIRQMREASTPSTRSRISFYTIAIMLFFDAMFTITMMCFSMYVDSGWVTTYGTAAFSLVNIFLFGMRFLADIWSVHAPELRRRAQEALDELRRQREAAISTARERQQATLTRPPPEPPAQPAQPPAATTPPTRPPPRPTLEVVDFGSLPVFMPSDQAGLQPVNPRAAVEAQVPTFGSIYMRFSFLLIIVLMLSGSAATYSSTLRRGYFTTLMLVYMSIWIPQILRNVQRNCRKALQWEFVLSQTVLRLIPIGYWYAWDENIFFIPAHRTTFTFMVLWAWAQVVILASQELVGPRWFVKKEWVAPAWDYHPILRSDLEGSTLPLGLADSVSLPSSPTTERRGSLVPKDTSGPGKRVFDCAICMQNLEVPVVDAGDAEEVNAAVSGSLMLARRSYMVTPCRHIFHTTCLEGWMKYRLQCPICREGLPPL